MRSIWANRLAEGGDVMEGDQTALSQMSKASASV